MLKELSLNINTYYQTSKRRNKNKSNILSNQDTNKTNSPIETQDKSDRNIAININPKEIQNPLFYVSNLPDNFNLNYQQINTNYRPESRTQRAKSANKLNKNIYPNFYSLININSNQNEIPESNNYLKNYFTNNQQQGNDINSHKYTNTSSNINIKLNDKINNLENMIYDINNKGFNKYQQEIENKKLKISKLENSIAILKNKININKNLKKDNLKTETMKKIKYEKLKKVSKRYSSVGKCVVNYKNEIPELEKRIYEIKNETIQINNIINFEQNEINVINDKIRKLNKTISDIKKENDNILPAIRLLKKHMNATMGKINNIDKGQSNFLNKINGFSQKL